MVSAFIEQVLFIRLYICCSSANPQRFEVIGWLFYSNTLLLGITVSFASSPTYGPHPSCSQSTGVMGDEHNLAFGFFPRVPCFGWESIYI